MEETTEGGTKGADQNTGRIPDSCSFTGSGYITISEREREKRHPKNRKRRNDPRPTPDFIRSLSFRNFRNHPGRLFPVLISCSPFSVLTPESNLPRNESLGSRSSAVLAIGFGGTSLPGVAEAGQSGHSTPGQLPESGPGLPYGMMRC